MLIMNQNHDALVDTTGARIKIDEMSETSHYRYRVNWYGAGMRETISEHIDLEDAKKVVLLIHLANAAGLDSLDFYGDTSKLDDTIEVLNAVITEKTFKLMRGE